MKNLYLVLAALIVGGCAHLPAEEAKPVIPAAPRRLSTAVAAETIVKGKTTRKEILEKIGAPNSIDRKTGPSSADASAQGAATGEIWNYWTPPPLQAIGRGGEHPVFRMTIDFDANGVVRDYQAADTSIIVR